MGGDVRDEERSRSLPGRGRGTVPWRGGSRLFGTPRTTRTKSAARDPAPTSTYLWSGPARVSPTTILLSFASAAPNLDVDYQLNMRHHRLMESNFGARIRKLRKYKGLTQRQLAGMVGIDHTFLSKIENNRPGHRPSESVILSIAMALEADPSSLLFLADKIPAEARESIVRSPSGRKLVRLAEELTESEWKELLRNAPRRPGSARSRMLIDASDLEQWAPRRDAQGTLPRLIRLLVLATARDASRVSFRTGDGVGWPGWDGTVTSAAGNAFVPSGISAWELSTEGGVKSKADEDYRKRTDDPREIRPAETTFVFANPRRWREKEAWAAARSAEGKWAGVRAHDADDLEGWLELAPSVHLWISRLLGKSPEGAIDLGGFWLDSSESTTPPLTAEIVAGGRGAAIEEIQKWIRTPSNSIGIQAGSDEEALLMLAAAVHLLPEDERDAVLSRAIVVDTSSAWRNLVHTVEPLILIPRFELREEIGAALRAGHAVVVPLGPGGRSPSSVLVPRASREAVSKAFLNLGIAESKARELGELARAGFKSLLRRLAVRPEVRAPAWSQPAEGPALARLMLAGAWSEGSDDDRRIIEKITGSSYAEAERVMLRWENEPDPPVKRVQDAWFFVSKEDAWSLLGRYITSRDLEGFREAALQVLGTPDPEFDVPDEERWLARVHGHVQQHSEHLVKGVANTLAIAGTRGNTLVFGSGSAADYAARTVCDVLERANGDWRVWASLSRELSLIAEAAPDSFLTALEAGASGKDPVLRQLFRDKTGGLFESSPHQGLLWALEVLAWSPIYLGRASIALAALSRLDPGGKTGNRPLSSLTQIFLPWFPQTSASREQRHLVIDALIRREPSEGWKLLVSLLPETHSATMSAPRPTYRDWAPDVVTGAGMSEYINAVHDTVVRALAHVGNDVSRWVDLIEAVADLPSEDHELVVSALENLDLGKLEGSGPGTIWEAMRRLISQHRSFSDAKWALPGERLERLELVWKRFTPSDLVTKYAWLFGPNPELLKPTGVDWDAHDRSIVGLRREAVEEIFAEEGIQGLLAFAAKTEHQYEVGAALGRSGLMDGAETKFLREHLLSDDSVHAQVAYAFAGSRTQARGRKWLDALLNDPVSSWSPGHLGTLLIFLPCDQSTWDLAERLGQETEIYYWGHINPLFTTAEADLSRAVQQFLRAHRPDAAIAVAAREVMGKRVVAPALAVEALEGFLKNPPSPDRTNATLLAHNVGMLLSVLEPSPEVGEDRIATLEWAFLPLLRRGQRHPRYLHRKLAWDPGFFVEVLSLVYRAEGDAPREASREDQQRARHGHELLDSWRTLPGIGAEGSISAERLLSWVRAARTAAGETGRTAIGDQLIGQMLSGSPPGADCLWPHEAVREVLEEVGNAEIESGLEIGRYNGRGVTSRDPLDGGNPERELSKAYREASSATAFRWPRTGAMLLRIAETYERDARRQDQEAELREDTFG